LTALIHEVVTIEITKSKRSNDYLSLGGSFSPATLQAAFWWREIGVYAVGAAGTETLYCYSNAFEEGEYIQPDAQVLERTLTVGVIVGDAQAVTVTINESLAFATQSELKKRPVIQIGGDEPEEGPCLWFDTSGLAPNTVSASLELGGPGDTAELMAQVDSTDFPVENAKTKGTPKAGEYSFDII
jgi:hypothetical protein